MFVLNDGYNIFLAALKIDIESACKPGVIS
jgi:hypothetical protein